MIGSGDGACCFVVLSFGRRLIRCGAARAQSTVPCWKPHLLLDKRKTKLHFAINEEVRLHSYGHNRRDKDVVPDAWSVSGRIDCKVRLLLVKILFTYDPKAAVSARAPALADVTVVDGGVLRRM